MGPKGLPENLVTRPMEGERMASIVVIIVVEILGPETTIPPELYVCVCNLAVPVRASYHFSDGSTVSLECVIYTCCLLRSRNWNVS